jgi:phosphoglycerate dehydrogenase-like enzyme
MSDMVSVRIALLDDYQDVGQTLADWTSVAPDVRVDSFTVPMPPHERVAALAPYDVVVAMRERTPFPAELLRALPRLRLLVTTGMRNASIDLDAARALGIAVAGTGSKSGTTAELAWALILALLRDVPANDRRMRAGGWQGALGGDVAGETLGVLGLGRLGTRVAGVGRAFGMHVIAWGRSLAADRAERAGVEAVEFDELFERSRVVSVHLALTDETRGFVGAPALAALGSEGFLVNTSRAAIVDEGALRRALEGGGIAGAGLDVYDEEPLPPSHWLRSAPRTILSPHLGYATRENFGVFYREAAEDVRAFLSGLMLRRLDVDDDGIRT